jgi:hypothetical protein
LEKENWVLSPEMEHKGDGKARVQVFTEVLGEVTEAETVQD